MGLTVSLLWLYDLLIMTEVFLPYLPERYSVSEVDAPAIGLECDSSRLSIAGLLDYAILRRKNEALPLGPTPLLLVDGQEAKASERGDASTRHFFYGPGHFQELTSIDWAYHVDVPDDVAVAPSSYLGHGGVPDEAEALLFDQSIPYDQEVFEQAARHWLRRIV